MYAYRVSQGTPFSQSRGMRGGVKVAAWWFGRGMGRLMKAMGRNGNGDKARLKGFEGIGSIPQWNVRYVELEMDLLGRINQVREQEARLYKWKRELIKSEKELDGVRAKLAGEAGGLYCYLEELQGREAELKQQKAELKREQAELKQEKGRISDTVEKVLRQKEKVDRLVKEYDKRQQHEESKKNDRKDGIGHQLRQLLSNQSGRDVEITFEDVSVEKLSGRIRLR